MNNPAVPGKLDDLYKTPGGVAYTLPVGENTVELRNLDGTISATVKVYISVAVYLPLAVR